ncbi:hypothetical protein E2C01_066196 [Portunus trituberculatus]|uniref:Uncharacterized protein n=1 Tax=Portunus trituberculatus TaxID=210409 RepID=A0A5B7HU06_PORTR|nr:hypothetical protein [Portunus trituberculatus]
MRTEWKKQSGVSDEGHDIHTQAAVHRTPFPCPFHSYMASRTANIIPLETPTPGHVPPPHPIPLPIPVPLPVPHSYPLLPSPAQSTTASRPSVLSPLCGKKTPAV